MKDGCIVPYSRPTSGDAEFGQFEERYSKQPIFSPETQKNDYRNIGMGIVSLTIRPLVALITLTIGVLIVNVFSYWNFPVIPIAEPTVDQEPLMISPCELYEASGRFVGKRVSLDATVWHVSGSYKEKSEDFIMIAPLMPKGCSDIKWDSHAVKFDSFISTELDLQDYVGPNQGLESSFGAFKREVDVHIVGSVKRSLKDYGSVPYRIVPENITVISPWRKVTAKGGGG